MLRLFDTAVGEVVPVIEDQAGSFRMYVCGPTVSGEPHLGHGRFTVTWDVARRYLRWRGHQVRFVSNVTDIEDKILARAATEGRRPEEVAAHYERLWWETMKRLGVEVPDATPHATEYVESMVCLIAELVESGHAYLGADGVYFAAESVPGYGLLARQPLETLRAGARVEADAASGKRSPVDFVLWKLAKPGEPAWSSPWGPGRPGWHTECVVMSLDLLGEGFDLHAGGLDLAFPHHENERAQALAAGRRFARHWAHNGMIVDEVGAKMSKSEGNTTSLVDLLDAFDPRAFRLLLMQSHYRRPVSTGEAALDAARAGVERLDGFARQFAGARRLPPDQGVLESLRERMDDDLDTPGAVALAFETLRRARSASGEEAGRLASAVLEFCEAVLGLPLGQASTGPPPSVLARAAQRDQARRARDWATADAIRSELLAEGWTVEDGPDGTVVR